MTKWECGVPGESESASHNCAVTCVAAPDSEEIYEERALMIFLILMRLNQEAEPVLQFYWII